MKILKYHTHTSKFHRQMSNVPREFSTRILPKLLRLGKFHSFQMNQSFQMSRIDLLNPPLSKFLHVSSIISSVFIRDIIFHSISRLLITSLGHKTFSTHSQSYDTALDNCQDGELRIGERIQKTSVCDAGRQHARLNHLTVLHSLTLYIS